MTKGTLSVTVDTTALRLACEAMSALEKADLGDALDEVSARLLSTESRGWTVEADPGKAGTVRMRWQPYAELVLRDVIGIAQSTSSAETKASRIRSALALGGY